MRRSALVLLLSCHLAASAQPVYQGLVPPALRFGVIPMGDPRESRDSWSPLLADLGRALGRPVSALSVASYPSLDSAIQRKEIDLALLSGRLALDAVMHNGMRVVARVARREGAPLHRAVLLVRADGPVPDLQAVLDDPGRWRLARGDMRSVSGFIQPQTELFLPHNIDMETRFRGDIIGTHQSTALAVANGDADLATNNTTDFDRFKLQFPVEAQRLRAIWVSEPTPPAVVVLKREQPPAFVATVQRFLVGYGQGKGQAADAERAVLRGLYAEHGFAPASNADLLHVVTLEHQRAKRQAMNARWVDEASRQARLQRLDGTYAEQSAALRDPAP